jgi:hypothetical protein
MKKLWVFGDSFSMPFIHLNKEYCDFKGYIPKTYYEIVAENKNMKLESHGYGGADNHTILEKIIFHIDKIDVNDIVIIGWTDWFRTRVVNKNDWWECLNPGHINQPTIEMPSYSVNTIKEIILNRGHQLYVNEINNMIKLVKFALRDSKVIDWCWIDELDQLDCGIKHIGRQITIKEETNDTIPDYHWGEDGHKVLSKKILELLSESKII